MVGVGGEEGHGDAILAKGGQGNAVGGAGRDEQIVRHLDQNTGTVSALDVVARTAAVLHACQHSEGFGDDGVGLASLEVGDEADATAVMLEFGTIEATVA